MDADASFWKRCSNCKTELPFAGMYWACNVSTCNRPRTALVFCSVSCWDAHVPTLRHRDAWAEERRSPTAAECRLLVEHDEEVEAERQAGSVDQDRLAAEEETLPDDHRDDGDVAGIAHVAEAAAHDQPLGRRDGRRGAVTPADEADEEIQKDGKREQDQNEPDPAHGCPPEERWLDPPSREQAGHHHDHRSRNEGDEHDRADGRGEQGPLARSRHVASRNARAALSHRIFRLLASGIGCAASRSIPQGKVPSGCG